MNPKIKLLKLTKLQQDIIIGTLLGNSTMQNLDIYNEKKAIINFWQDKEDLEYLKFVFLAMKEFSPFNSIKDFNEIDKDWFQMQDKNQLKYSKGFYTYPLEIFVYYFDIFYRWDEELNLYKKIIPSNIYNLISPQRLAFWIMDTGIINDKGLIICTDTFTELEVLFLIEMLKAKFNIQGELKLNSRGLNRIFLNLSSFYVLQDVVKDSIIKCMRSKFKF